MRYLINYDPNNMWSVAWYFGFQASFRKCHEFTLIWKIFSVELFSFCAIIDEI